MVVKEFLDSDRVNFLVWKYLLEGNFRETAAKFQKEWHVKEPHRDLEFAPHVQGHALVSVVNRGLLYHALEREHTRKQLPQDTSTEPDSLQVGVFGPLDPPLTAKKEDDGIPAPAELEAARKRAQSNFMNGSPSKRPKTSSSYGNPTEPDGANPTPMDVDQGDNHAYPSPLEGEQETPVMARTDGPEQGTQIEKVEELTAETTFIHLANDAAAHRETTPSTSPGDLDNAPILLQCEWNPRDPSMLAAAGTDALARVWTVSRAPASKAGQDDHVHPHQAHALVNPDTPRTTTVTALAWTADGNAIAVASDSGSRANISIWSADGVNVQSMEITEPPVVRLLWNPSSTALLAISPEKGGAVVTVYSTATGNSISYHLTGHDIGATPLDATWTSDAEFLLCGGDSLISLHCTDSAIVQVRKFETKDDDSFSQVLFDWRSKLAATSSDKGVLDLWDESGQRRSISAHQGAITTMEWQPLPPSQPIAEDERLIATGGDDCAILIWNARKPESKAKCFLTMDSPIVKLAFTPDGAFIAGATSRQVLIWKVGSTAMPRASWSRPPHPGWLSPKGTSDSDEEDEHCLAWDVSGQKLAYGSNSRLAVINFTR